MEANRNSNARNHPQCEYFPSFVSCVVATGINQMIAQKERTKKLFNNNLQPSHGQFVKIAKITQLS